MVRSTISHIKHSQRESFFQRELSSFFIKIQADEPSLATLYITRVKLTQDRGSVLVFFCSNGGITDFREKMEKLILYKPSLRAALAKILQSRYTPNLKFVYDEEFEEQQKVSNLIDRLKDEGKL